MAFDLFISYSSEDKTIADAVCAGLEQANIRCWLAPRDIMPGKSWSEAIIDAISETQLMIIIFSAKANASPQVMREVERAVSKGLAIIPFRVEDVMPSKSMEYFLSTPHWLDAMSPPLEGHIEKLVTTAQAILNPDSSTAHISKAYRAEAQSNLPKKINLETKDVAPDDWGSKNQNSGIKKFMRFILGE